MKTKGIIFRKTILYSTKNPDDVLTCIKSKINDGMSFRNSFIPLWGTHPEFFCGEIRKRRFSIQWGEWPFSSSSSLSGRVVETIDGGCNIFISIRPNMATLCGLIIFSVIFIIALLSGELFSNYGIALFLLFFFSLPYGGYYIDAKKLLDYVCKLTDAQQITLPYNK